MATNDTSPRDPDNALLRFRVHLTERHFYHLDVFARSQNEAAGIAVASSERWVDDDDGSSDASIVFQFAPDDPDFYPPDGACETCGCTLTPDEERTASTCDRCRYLAMAESHEFAP